MYDVLDRSNPVPIVFENDYFNSLCKSWGDAATVQLLMANEAAQRARYAAAEAARQTRAKLAMMVRPTYTPTREVPPTGPIPLVAHEVGFADQDATQLLAYMAANAEPDELPTHRFPRLRRFGNALRRLVMMVPSS